MADSDQSLYNLRYNQISQQLEAFGGGSPSWSILTIQNPDPVAGITQLTGDVTAGPGAGSVAATIANGAVIAAKIASGAVTTAKIAGAAITPALISTTTTDDFTFPRDVTVARNLFVQPSLSGQTATMTLGDAASATALFTLKAANGNQAIIAFNSNGSDQWTVLHQVDDTFEIADAQHNIPIVTCHKSGGVDVKGNLTLADSTATIALAGATPISNPGIDVSVNGVVFSPEVDIWKSGSAGAGNSDKAGIILGESTGEVDIYSQGNAHPLRLEFPSAILDTTAGFVNPDASAALDIVSTTSGLLPPRMSTIQKNAIASPAEGLVVADTTMHALNYYTGSTWQALGSGGGFTPQVQFQTSTTAANPANSTYVAVGPSASMALQSASNKVNISVVIPGYVATGSTEQDFTILFDGSAVNAQPLYISQNNGGSGFITVTFNWVAAPGDTSSHTYQAAVKSPSSEPFHYLLVGGIGSITLVEINQ